MAADSRLEHQLRRRSIALFVLLALAVAASVGFVLRELVNSRLATAAISVGAVLVLAGMYALMVDRGHARRALSVAAGIRRDRGY